jgi:dihydroorotate dehydrogenase (NAD+) catalytic subunit
MLAAGILGISPNLLTRVYLAGAGAVVSKTIGPRAKQGNKNPVVVGTDCGLLNAMGLPNPGIDEFIVELEQLKNSKIPIIVSVFGDTTEEFKIITEKISGISSVKALELNISCPHSKVSQIGQDPELTEEIVRAARGITSLPLFVKLTPNVTDITKIAEKAESAGADAITAINTVRAMAIDVETAYPILSNVYGGLSGAAIRPIAIRNVFDIYKTVKIPIIGVGGIEKWEDVIEFFYAGASAVQIGTSMVKNDIDVFESISNGLLAFLERKNVSNIQELTGKTHDIIAARGD